ncbi:arylesterase [Methyloterricola oryzae]|uniref:arylesterase n=1 Tax=Methyloterricola oryzae TaxID=1495050 RepID=UPI0005EB111F|nr:arylesterase [Methyloterricola oryzae]
MRIVLLVVCLLLGCSSSPKLTPVPPDGVILAFGDSLTHGTGAGDGESYPEVLQGLIGRTVVNAGIPGETTAEGLARLPGVLDETTPRLMILCLGGNDFLRRLDEKQAADNLRAMVALARSRGVEVVLMAVPRFGLTLSPPELYAQMAEELKLPLESGIMRSVVMNSAMKSDEVHPNAAGYKAVAEALAELLRKSGAV